MCVSAQQTACNSCAQYCHKRSSKRIPACPAATALAAATATLHSPRQHMTLLKQIAVTMAHISHGCGPISGCRPPSVIVCMHTAQPGTWRQRPCRPGSNTQHLTGMHGAAPPLGWRNSHALHRNASRYNASRLCANACSVHVYVRTRVCTVVQLLTATGVDRTGCIDCTASAERSKAVQQVLLQTQLS